MPMDLIIMVIHIYIYICWYTIYHHLPYLPVVKGVNLQSPLFSSTNQWEFGTSMYIYIDVLMFGTAPKESISRRWWFLEHTLVESSAEKNVAGTDPPCYQWVNPRTVYVPFSSSQTVTIYQRVIACSKLLFLVIPCYSIFFPYWIPKSSGIDRIEKLQLLDSS